MFGHNFKYTFKVLMRSRMLLFWTFVFPLVLGTMFKLAFSNIENSEKLNVIPIAIIDNEDFQGNEAFRRTFETLSDESSDEQMFDTVYVSKDEADTLLSDGDVDGVLYMNGEQPEIWIHENGINQTVLQYVVDEIVHTTAIMEKRVQNELEQGAMPDIEALYKDVMEQVAGRESNLVDASRANMSYTMIEYYTLIAMACLYGGILGMTALSRNLPNMGNLGKRTAIVPISKAKTMFSSLLAAYCTQLIGLAYLSVLFKNEVGTSYVKYLTNMRITQAKKLLKDGHKVNEVSEMVGYSNYRYFSDIFKKHVGLTPNEYKHNY